MLAGRVNKQPTTANHYFWIAFPYCLMFFAFSGGWKGVTLFPQNTATVGGYLEHKFCLGRTTWVPCWWYFGRNSFFFSFLKVLAPCQVFFQLVKRRTTGFFLSLFFWGGGYGGLTLFLFWHKVDAEPPLWFLFSKHLFGLGWSQVLKTRGTQVGLPIGGPGHRLLRHRAERLLQAAELGAGAAAAELRGGPAASPELAHPFLCSCFCCCFLCFVCCYFLPPYFSSCFLLSWLFGVEVFH